MATYVNNLRLKEITTGAESGTWGISTNTNLELITDGFSYGTKQLAADANETFTMPDGSSDDTRSLYLKLTSAVDLTATREVTLGPNTISKTWVIENATSGSQTVTIKQGSGATVDVPTGEKVMVVTDGAGAGAAVFNANPTPDAASLSGVTPIANGGTGSASGDLSNCTADGTNSVGTSNVSAVGTKTSSYTLATGDVGKYVQVGTGGSITIPDATFSEGDAVSIFNNTTGNITITCSITTAYISGTDTDQASVTLATRGVATILFISGTVCVITGSVT
jgi:hypothetical protein